MKKRLLTLITLIMSVIMGASAFSGCNLVTSNTERDLNQVVATVNVNQKENIYKKDLIMGYLNYGYMYVQYYGYDNAKTYGLILDNLIDNRIVVQVAYEKFEKGDDAAGIAKRVINENEKVYTPARYLTEEEITEAKYSAYESVNDLLDSYTDKGDEDKKDTLIFAARTIPTDAKNAEEEVDKAEYVKNIDDNGFDVLSVEKRTAFNKVIKLLENNGLKGASFDGTLNSTDYFKQLLKSSYENEIIKNYEEEILKGVKSALTYADLENLFDVKVNKQKGWSNEEFVSALSSATASEPVLYSGYGTYGYVYNLLISVNDYQNDKISELKEEREHKPLTDEEYSAERAKILAGTIVQDLRGSWILSGYDFDFDTKKFTGDYTFAKDAANSLAFKGTVEKVSLSDEDEDEIYRITGVDTFGLEDFTKFVNEYVYGDTTAAIVPTSSDRYFEYDTTYKPNEYDAKIQELLFAFSTDPGSLNSYKGYTIKPAVDGEETEEYVKTFGEAGRDLLEKGGSSYKVVASDYGYHFMFFSEVWNAGDGYANLSAYLNTLGIDKGTATWEEYFNAQKADWEKFEEDNGFLYILANELISEKLSDKASESKTAIVTEYRYGAHKDRTVIYKDRFSDLLG